ncbi:hypothetical protein CANTEDRAFT_112341, partial [Yamadazyma tenuis ATCC 10573]
MGVWVRVRCGIQIIFNGSSRNVETLFSSQLPKFLGLVSSKYLDSCTTTTAGSTPVDWTNARFPYL